MNEISIFGIFLSAMLINNIILLRFIGLCPFFGVSNKMDSAIGMSMALIFVMTMATATTWLMYNYLLVPMGLVFLKIASFILTIAALVQLVEIFMKKFALNLYKALGIYLPLITTNCAILAVAFLHVDYGMTFIQAIVYSLGVSTGFAMVIVLFAGVREKFETAPVPKALQGYPIAFFTAALMSLAFLGFKGLFGL